MNDDAESNTYIFHVANAVMAVVLGLMIEKIGNGVAAAFRYAPRGIDVDMLPPLLMELTIFLTGVSVIATLAHLHRGARLPYRRHYFFMDLLAGGLFLYVAFACVHQSAFGAVHESGGAFPDVDVNLICKGLTVLSASFVVLVARAFMAHAAIPRPEERRKVLWVVPFHLSGIGLSVLACVWPQALFAFAVAGAAGAMLYLALFWAMRLEIKVAAE
jgi:hypothetical protein